MLQMYTIKPKPATSLRVQLISQQRIQNRTIIKQPINPKGNKKGKETTDMANRKQISRWYI